VSVYATKMKAEAIETIPNTYCNSGFYNFRLCRQFQVLENSMLCGHFQFAEFHVM